MTFLLLMTMGTLITISSNSWITAWMGLEMNLIMFISLILNNKKISSIEAALIYFLIQSMASILFLYSTMIFIMNNYLHIFNNMMMFSYLTIAALMMKLGAAPLHYWLPMVMKGMTWNNNYLIMTWQKLGPMIMLYYCMNNLNNWFIFIFIMFSSTLGPLKGFNQTLLKKMMSYSSINYSSWMIMSMMLNIILWKMFMLFYFFMLICLILMFKMLNLYSMKQLYWSNKNYKMNFILMTNILSMGGLPPFMGFFPKMMIIMNMIKSKMLLLIMIMLMTNLINLYYYMRIIYSTLMLNFTKNKSIIESFYNKNSLNKLIVKNMLMKVSYLTNMAFFPLLIMFYFIM